jgi:hypothetical protein
MSASISPPISARLQAPTMADGAPLSVAAKSASARRTRRNDTELTQVIGGIVTPNLFRDGEPSKAGFLARIQISPTGCWIWHRVRKRDGYGTARPKNRKKTVLATHLAWRIFRGDIPPGMIVCHKCDNPPCCNPDHLFVGTHLDNALDAMKKGRRAVHKPKPQKLRRGTYPLMKLTVADVEAIRASTESTVVLGRRYGISRQHAWQIRHGERCTRFTATEGVGA